MPIQQELKVESPDEPPDDVYEEEPRRRPWAAFANVVLALALIVVGYQWNQAVSHEQALESQVRALRVDAESQRLRAEETQRQLAEAQKRLAALSAERTALEERIGALGRVAKERVPAKGPERERASAAAATKDPQRAGVEPASARKRR
jgi:uncharacterized protein HemX